jgi:hypothetical protein
MLHMIVKRKSPQPAGKLPVDRHVARQLVLDEPKGTTA